MALIKCQHFWLGQLDRDAAFVRAFSFDFSKAFDSVSHRILFSKLASYDINPYIKNWIISLGSYSLRSTERKLFSLYTNANSYKDNTEFDGLIAQAKALKNSDRVGFQEQCHEDFAVLGQFCAKIITLGL